MSARGRGPADAGLSFGERYARWACVMLAMLALVVAVSTVGASPSRALLLAAVFVLACLPGFRRRYMYDEQRRNEAMEDERDRDVRLRAAAVARALLATGVVMVAVVLCIPATRQVLLAGDLVLPGMLVLLAIASALGGYAWEIRGYRAGRP